MHWIDRGPEPVGLPEVREHYTPGWVRYYRDRHGDRPTDSHWRRFAGVLQQRFDDLCAYCEGTRRGVVDHLRPKSRFPEFVYEWSNWLFACHACNHAKGWKWPPGGYVDPCAASKQARPESYFIFDTVTGEILPKEDLTPRRRRKALKTIEDLQLNARQSLRDRLEWLRVFSLVVPVDPKEDAPFNAAVRRRFASRATKWSSISRAFLSERGYRVDD